VVADFLAKHSEYALVEQRQLLPDTDDSDGFFIAKMQREPAGGRVVS